MKRIYKGRLGLGALVVLALPLFFLASLASLAFSRLTPLLAVSGSLIPTALPDVQAGADGTLQTNIPLTLPATDGHAPELSLFFRGGEGGLLGNWDISGLPAISRNQAKGVHYNSGDGFIASVGGELVRLTDGTFRTKVDNNVIYNMIGDCAVGACYWTATLADGTVLEFGNSADSHINGAGSQAHSWTMNRSQDLNGNYWTVSYYENAGQFRPKEIIYSKNDSLGLVERRVQFNYTTLNVQKLRFFGGNRRDSSEFLSNIKAFYKSDEVFEFRFSYEQEADSGRYRLTGYQEFIEGVQESTPLNFSYTNNDLTFETISSGTIDTGLGAPNYPICKVGAEACFLAQFDGTLTPDALAVAQGFCGIYQVTQGPRCSIGNTHNSGDLNGDGFTDFIAAKSPASPGGGLADAQIGWLLNPDAPASPLAFSSDNQSFQEVGSQFYADMNGDGKADYIRLKKNRGLPTTYAYSVSLNNGSGFDAPVDFSPPGGMGMGYDPDEFLKELLLMFINHNIEQQETKRQKPWNNVRVGTHKFRDPMKNDLNFNRINAMLMKAGPGRDGFGQLADMNGDGLSDYIRMLSTGQLSTAFSNGAGFSRERNSTVDTGIGLGDGFRSLGDFNGDGIPDFVVMVNEGGYKLKVFRGHTDGSFTHLHTSPILDPGHKDFRRLVDVNGDGYSDFVRMGDGSDQMQITFSNGLAYEHTTSSRMDTGNNFGRSFGDLNGDGALDLIRFVLEGGRWTPKARLFSRDNFSGREISIPGYSAADEAELKNRFVTFADANGDGRTDMILPGDTGISYVRSGLSQSGLLSSVWNGAGHKLNISYTKALNSAAVDSTQNIRKSGYSILANLRARMLVSSIELSHKGTKKSRSSYVFEDDRIKIGPSSSESRSLGFRRVTERSYVYKNGIETEGPVYKVTDYHQEHPVLGFDGARLPASITVYRKNGTLLNQEIPAYSRPPAYPHTGLIKIIETANTKTDAGTSRTIRTGSAVLEMDALGNPIRTQDFGDLDSPDDDKITLVTLEYPALQPAGRPTVVQTRTPAGITTSYKRLSYDAVGNVIREDSGPDASSLTSVEMTHDAAGNVLSTTRFGLTVSMEYDGETASRIIKNIEPDGLISSTSYNLKRGLLLSESDAYGKTVRYTYDNVGRRIRSELDAGGLLSSSIILETNSFSYDSSGVLTRTQDLLGPAGKHVLSISVTDQWGRALESRGTQEGGVVQVTKTYDEYDRGISTTLPFFVADGPKARSVTTYDDLGRVIRSESPGPNGNMVQSFTPETVETVSFTSLAGPTLRAYAVEQKRLNGQRIYNFKTTDKRILQKEYETAYADPSNPSAVASGWVRIRFHYDPLGRLVSVTRGAGPSRSSIVEDASQTSRIEYDAHGRKSRVYDPDKGQTSFSYTNEHQLLCTTRPDTSIICRTYDALFRLKELRQDSVLGKVLVEYRYDETESAYGQGRITSLKDDSGERRMHFDLMTGKVSRLERTYRARGAVKVFDITQTYDPTGALLKRNFSNTGLSLFYDYHTGGTLSRILLEDKDHRVLESGTSLTVLDIEAPNALGNSPRVKYGNGVSMDYDYDDLTGGMKEVNIYSSYHQGSIAHYGYKRNDENMLIEKNDYLKSNQIDRSESFVYDRAHRLLEARGPYGTRSNPVQTLKYTYGADGQPLLMGGVTSRYKATSGHRLKSAGDVTYEYDQDSGPGRGNVISRSTSRSATSFTYSWQNRIKTVSSVTENGNYSANYVYDDKGDQFSKEASFRSEKAWYHKLDQDYRIFTDGTNEIHRLEVRNRGALIAQFNFNAFHHLADASAGSELHQSRLSWDLSRLAHLEGGVFKSPFLMMSVATRAWQVAERIENKVLYLYWSLLVLLLSIALLWLIRLWRDGPRETGGLLPAPLIRISALCMLLVFYSTGACIPNVGSQLLLPLPNGGLPVSSEGNGASLSGHGPDKIIGAFFFVGTHNGSTDMVTNAQGKLVARFAYNPFGVQNTELSELDPDRNGVNYSGRFSFTGQEYEAETGLYNYKARIYDQHTGRFLQPDPVHSENAGHDNYDRYQYVHNNPVNFNDPSGKVVGALVATYTTLFSITAAYGFAKCGNMIYGRFTGPGLCPGEHKPPGDDANFQTAWLLNKTTNIEFKKRLFFLYWNANFINTKVGLTEVDESSRWHDRSNASFMGGGAFTKSNSFDGNRIWLKRNSSRWVGGGLLPIPTSRMAKNTWERERKAAPGGDRTVATINTAGTLLFEWTVSVTGILLFGTVNAVNYLTRRSVRQRHKKFHANLYEATNLSLTFGVDPFLILTAQYLGHQLKRASKHKGVKGWRKTGKLF